MDHSDKFERAQNPRETATILSWLTFSYSYKLFNSGFKKDLEYEDLYEVIKTCKSSKCADKLEHSYQAEARRSKPSIYRVLWSCYGIKYLLLGVINLSWNLLSSALEPDAISQLVAYFKPGQTKMSKNDALYYAGVIIALKVLHTVYRANFHVCLVQLAIQIRTALSSLIYRKSLKLSPRSIENTSLGNIVTIISKDLNEFEGAIWLFNDLVVGVIQTLYMCYLLYRRVGYASTAGILIMAFSLPIQMYIGVILKRLRLTQNKRTDQRLQETQEVLSTIRTIKMYTWEKIFADRIGITRSKELTTLLFKALAKYGIMVTSNFVGKIGFYSLVMLYIYFNASMNAETMFYVMRVYATLTHSVALRFNVGFSNVAEVVASMQRINKVLMLEELSNHIDKPDDDPQIDIRDASISMKYRDILNNITLKFDVGLNAVTGQLGCGKSSLIKMILKDFPAESGEVRTRGRMSYASQDPWLFPATIKQNILFGEHYDYERYSKVIEVCALSYDFAILEKGDETIVADRGMNLSKGQQARVNLARAIYKDSDIYLLDDCLTALDPKVQDHIFEKCIKNFLEGKLVLLVTHNSKHISQARITVVLENGRVKYEKQATMPAAKILEFLEEEIGEQKKEISTNKKFTKKDDVNEQSKLIQRPVQKKQVYNEVKKAGEVEYKIYGRYLQYGGGVGILSFMIVLFAIVTFADSSSKVMLTSWINQESNVMSLKEKYFGNSSVQLDGLYEKYYAAYHEKESGMVNTSLFFVPTSVWSINNTITFNETLTPINFSALTESQNRTFDVLEKYGKIEMQASKSLHFYSVLIVISLVAEFIRQYTSLKFGINASSNIHKAMVKSVISSKMAFFDTFFIGNMLNRFSQDLSVVDESLPVNMSKIIMAAFNFIGIVGTLASVSWKFTIPAIIILVVFVLLRYYYIPTARSLKRLEAATRSPIVGHLNSTMEGLTTIRAYKAQSILSHEYDKHQDVFTSAKFTSICTRMAFEFLMETTSVIFNVYIIARFLFFETNNAAGDVGLTLTQAASLTMVLQLGLSQWSEVENLMTSVERAIEYTNIEPEVTTGVRTPNWPTDGEIVYKNVSLKYANTNENVLRDISFSVKPEEKIGIVGRTGAGKSSIISILFRLYSHEGTILIDDVDTNTLSLDYLRQHISIIPQDPIMFSGTIRTNIDPLHDFTDEEIWNVLHKVHLDRKVPNLNTQVEDIYFTAGQRQLLSVARAVVRRNKIVVLDEATANMDQKTEKIVQKIIDENFTSCTVFIIAHRLQSILNCQKVMVLDKGEIVEYDGPNILLKNKRSKFHKMMQRFNSTD